jgi:uncharacterized protein involved in type VI secretion and phage assembly
MPIVIPDIPAEGLPSAAPASSPLGPSPGYPASPAGPAADPAQAFGGPRWHGVYPALVTDTADPAGAGRVLVRLPWAAGTETIELWARLAAPFAGAGVGAWFEPPVDAEVLVAFIGGDPAAPCVVGSLWSGANPPPPGTVQTGGPGRHVVRTAAGAELRLGTAPGDAPVALSTDDGAEVVIEADGAVRIADRSGNRVRLDSSGVTIEAAGKVALEAASVSVAAGQVTVEAGMFRASGVVQCDTLIANAVVATSYTPGAGNIW